MPQFSYRARDAQGQLIDDTLAYDSELGLREFLRGRNLFVIDVRQTRRGRNTRAVRAADLIVTVRQLRTMLNAGMPLVQGMDALAQQTMDSNLQEVLKQISRSVRHGASLGEAFADHPGVFPPLLIALVRSGELGGRLPDTLQEASRQLEQQLEIRQKVLNALAYPVFTLVATFITVLFMLIFVVPVFKQIYRDLKAPLPIVTQLLVDIANLILAYGWLMAIGGVALGIWCARYARTPGGRRKFDRWKLKIPLLGGLFLKSACANLTGSLAGLLESGLPLSKALVAAGEVCGNSAVGDVVKDAAASVMTGRTLSDALGETGTLPLLVVKMIAVGEQVGTLPHVLREVNSSFVMDVDYTMKRLLGLIEPIMVLFVAMIVGFVLVALYYPIFNLGNAFLGGG